LKALAHKDSTGDELCDQSLLTIHDFVMLNALAEAAPTRAALTRAVDFLKSVLAPKSVGSGCQK